MTSTSISGVNQPTEDEIILALATYMGDPEETALVHLKGFAQRFDSKAAAERLAARRAAEQRDALTPGDVLSLIGAAEAGRREGKTEEPALYFDLARRIALALGDVKGAERCVELAKPPELRNAR